MPLSCSVLGAEWRPRQENDSCLFYRPEIFMSISASTVEPLRDRRRIILSRPFRSSLLSLIHPRYTAGRRIRHRPPSTCSRHPVNCRCEPVTAIKPNPEGHDRLNDDSRRRVCLGRHGRDRAELNGNSHRPVVQMGQGREVCDRLGQQISSSGMPSSISITGM
jgi:hypothetical protein